MFDWPGQTSTITVFLNKKLNTYYVFQYCIPEKMAEFAGAAKKGKKTGAPEAPRFGRVRSNLKVGTPYMVSNDRLYRQIMLYIDGNPGSSKRWKVKFIQFDD